MEDESLKKRAYLEGMKLKKAGLDDEVIYARLEKQGFPDELARKVIANLTIQKHVDEIKNSDAIPKRNAGLIKAAAGVLLAVVSALIFPGIIIIPIGCIAGGIIYAVASKNG